MNTSFTTSADGTRIAWYDFGGSGPDVLLGHATGFCAAVWEPVLASLRPHFRCVGYDLRGHGSSHRPPAGREAWDWTRYAQDAHAVVRDAGLEHPFSVGHSCGAATALLLEEAHPGTFRAFVGFEPVTFTDVPPKGPDEERDLAVRTRSRRTAFPGRSEALDNFSTRGPFKHLHPDALAAYVDHGFEVQPDGSLVLRCRPEDEAEVYVMASAHNGFVDLPSVSPPVTVVHGANSVAFDEATLRAVAERVQHGRFVQMEGVGHFGALERPDEFARLVVERLTESVSPPR